MMGNALSGKLSCKQIGTDFAGLAGFSNLSCASRV